MVLISQSWLACPRGPHWSETDVQNWLICSNGLDLYTLRMADMLTITGSSSTRATGNDGKNGLGVFRRQTVYESASLGFTKCE